MVSRRHRLDHREAGLRQAGDDERDDLRRDVAAFEVGDDVRAVVGVEGADRGDGFLRLVVEAELGRRGGDRDMAIEDLRGVDPAGLSSASANRPWAKWQRKRPIR